MQIGKLMTMAAVVAACGCSTWQATRSAGTAYVDEFDLSAASCGQGKRVCVGQSVDGHPLTIAGKTYAHGFGARPESAVRFKANGKVTAFEAYVGIDDDAENAHPKRGYAKPSAVFKVWADGKVVWASGKVVLGQKPTLVRVALEGAREIVLETAGGGAWTALHKTNADWVDARFTFADGAVLEADDDMEAARQLGILTPPEKPEPQINGADIWGVRPGHPVIFRVATTGARPMRFTAEGLPAGVTLDAEKGILGGVAPQKAGDYDIVVTAQNEHGKATRTIRLAVGDTIALTPPMGWNSWNVCCYRLTDKFARDCTLAMEKSGLGNHGWSYINLDDWWEMNTSGVERVEMRRKDLGHEDVIGAPRKPDGTINTNRSFPDMKALTDYIHSFGFKAGLYSSPGPLTCGLCEGSYQHEMQDATSWANWGFDYIKYDWCTYGRIFKERTGWSRMEWERRDVTKPLTKPAPAHDEFVRPYRIMGECLKKQNRDILYSLCQYGMADSHLWARSVGGNCWRSWDDLKDSWTWMETAIESHIGGEFWKYCGPGCWGDPDMMIVGGQLSFGYDHPTFLTPNEQYTHVSIWSMISSPMLIGCDLTKLDDFTYSILANDEVIAISQDRLGLPARRVRHTDSESVWVRKLANGDTAVALMSRYPFAREITVSVGDMALDSERFTVRDCWRQEDEGKFAGSYTVEVPAHATKLIRIKPITCNKCD